MLDGVGGDDDDGDDDDVDDGLPAQVAADRCRHSSVGLAAAGNGRAWCWSSSSKETTNESFEDNRENRRI